MTELRAPLVVTDDGEIPFRRPQRGIPPVGDFDLVTKKWAQDNLGGGGGGGGGGSGEIIDMGERVDGGAELDCGERV